MFVDSASESKNKPPLPVPCPRFELQAELSSINTILMMIQSFLSLYDVQGVKERYQKGMRKV